MRRFGLLFALAALVLSALPAAAAPPDGDERGRIPGSYIVVLNDGEPGAVSAEHSRRHNSSVTHVYRHALRGYAARMSEQAAANIARDPRVAYVEQDGVVTASTTQSNATWGLDRVDQRALPLSGTYTYGATGAGVTAYIVDTGIRSSHSQFYGRIAPGETTIADGRGTDDCNGHGTHVAGTVGGTVHGVARGVTLVPVRVLDCKGSGTWSGVIAGLDWVTANAKQPAVANMSLGGGASSSVDAAVQRLIDSGVSVVVAAGNGDRWGRAQNACNYSPARVPAAVTIGATTSSDAKTSWSNYGSCVDFFAPGASITSAWYSGDNATNTISGTSMAAPHVAGAAALHLQGNSTATPQQVRDALYANTTPGIVTSSSTANNHLLYTPGGTDGGGSPEPDPTVPAAPTNLTAQAVSTSAIALAWTDNSSDENGFEIEQSPDGVTGWSVIGSVGPGSTDYTNAGLDADRTYYYRVLAMNDVGRSTASNVASAKTLSNEPDPDPAGLTLSAVGYKDKGLQKADLTWSSAASTNVDVFRDGALLTTTANDGAHTDPINNRGGGSYAYRVCEAGTDTCSDTVTVSF